MGEHHTLRVAGGARAVRQHREMGGRVEADVGRRQTCRQQVDRVGVRAGLLTRAVENDHRALGQTDLGSGGLGLLFELRDGDQHLRARVRELLGDVLGGEQRVDRRRGGARAQDAVEDKSKRRGVGRVQGHHVADADTAGRQGSGEPVDAGDQFAVGDAFGGTGIDRGNPIEVFLADRPEQRVVDRRIRDLDRGIRALETHDLCDLRSVLPGAVFVTWR